MAKESKPWTNFTAGFIPPLDMKDFQESLRAYVREGEELHREILRGESVFVETPCPECGRRPIVRDGPTYVVCKHILAAIKEHCVTKPASEPSVFVPVSLGGVAIELFDDGPARW